MTLTLWNLIISSSFMLRRIGQLFWAGPTAQKYCNLHQISFFLFLSFFLSLSCRHVFSVWCFLCLSRSCFPTFSLSLLSFSISLFLPPSPSLFPLPFPFFFLSLFFSPFLSLSFCKSTSFWNTAGEQGFQLLILTRVILTSLWCTNYCILTDK